MADIFSGGGGGSDSGGAIFSGGGGGKKKASPKSDRQQQEELLAGQIVRQLSSANKKIQQRGQKALDENQGILSSAVRKKYGLPAAPKKPGLFGKVLQATGIADPKTPIGGILKIIGAPGQAVAQGIQRGQQKDWNPVDIARGVGAGLKTAVDPKQKLVSYTELRHGEGATPKGFGGWAEEVIGGAVIDPMTYVSLGTSTVAKGALKALDTSATELVLKQAAKEGGELAGKAFATDAERAAAQAARMAEAKAAGRAITAKVRTEGITKANRDLVRGVLTKAAEERGGTIGRGGVEKVVDRQMKVLSRGAKGGLGVLGHKTGFGAVEGHIPGVDTSFKTELGMRASAAISRTPAGRKFVSALQDVADGLSTKAGVRRDLGDVIADVSGQGFAEGRGVAQTETLEALKTLTKTAKMATKAKVWTAEDILKLRDAIQAGTLHELPDPLRQAGEDALAVIAKAKGIHPEDAPGMRDLTALIQEGGVKWLKRVHLTEAEARKIMEEGVKTAEATTEIAPRLFSGEALPAPSALTLGEKEARLRAKLSELGVQVPENEQLLHQNPLSIAAETARVGGEQHAVQTVIDGLAKIHTPDGFPLVSQTERPGLVKLTVTIDNVPQTIYTHPALKTRMDQLSRYLTDDRAVRAVTRSYDAVNNMFKGLATVPVFAPLIQGAHFLGAGFHMRNMQGNILLNGLKGITPADYTRAFMFQVRKARGALNEEDSKLLKALQKTNTIGTDAGLTESVGWTERAALRGLGASSKLRRTAHTAKYLASPLKEGAAVDTGRMIGTLIEDNAKIAHFMHMVDRGLSPESAAMSVKETLFDYEDLTEFERRVLKRVVPFYTFMRKNVPLQISELGKHPGYALNQQRAEAALTRDPNANEAIPNYALQRGERPLTDFGKKILGGKGADPMTFRWDTPLNAAKDVIQPYVQLAALIPGVPGTPPVNAQEAYRDFLSLPGGGPIGMAKAWIEIATGKDLFTGGDVKLKDGRIAGIKVSNKELMHFWRAVNPSEDKADRAELDSMIAKLTGLKGRTMHERQQLGEIMRRIEVLRQLNKAAGVPTLEEERRKGKAPKLRKPESDSGGDIFK